jgi:murein DD-endopeptidase MepM/ murein hydrolase activator NlpD
MRSISSSDHRWLKYRIRFLALGVFALSLFVSPYESHEDELVPPPEMVEEGIDSQHFFIAEDGFLMKTSSLTEQGTRSAFTAGIVHTVESGESIGSIAKQSFLSPDTIRYANNLGAKDSIKPGQKLLILPVDGVLHTVKRGQNLEVIADLYSVDAALISRQNKITKGYLFAGQQLIIPGGKPIIEVIKPKPVIAQKPIKTTKPATKPVALSTDVLKDLQGFSRPTNAGIFQMPCDCFYTQYFGKSHFGVDLQHRGGSPIYAAEDGKVVRADYGWNGGYGNVIVVDHGNGLQTLYAHNKKMYVSAGQQVTRGQPIAFMGNTGRVHGPTGIHLHFEVIQHGIKKNPLMYLR